MNANNDDRMTGLVDQEAFEKVIRDNLSPEAVATIIAFLQPAAFYRPANDDAMRALRQVEWFVDTNGTSRRSAQRPHRLPAVCSRDDRSGR